MTDYSKRDWQAECLKKGFEYVRESDDHYVLADVPEMAALLSELLGVEVRDKDNHSYGETVSSLNEQIDAANNAFHRAYELEKEVEALRPDAERWRFVRNPLGNASPFAVWSEGTKVFLGPFADEAIDAAISKATA